MFGSIKKALLKLSDNNNPGIQVKVLPKTPLRASTPTAETTPPSRNSASSLDVSPSTPSESPKQKKSASSAEFASLLLQFNSKLETTSAEISALQTQPFDNLLQRCYAINEKAISELDSLLFNIDEKIRDLPSDEQNSAEISYTKAKKQLRESCKKPLKQLIESQKKDLQEDEPKRRLGHLSRPQLS